MSQAVEREIIAEKNEDTVRAVWAKMDKNYLSIITYMYSPNYYYFFLQHFMS
jgi:hypothetical protein